MTAPDDGASQDEATDTTDTAEAAVRPQPTWRDWFRPGLAGLHLLGIVAIVLCVVMGRWQLGSYADRQGEEQRDRAGASAPSLTETWPPSESFATDLVGQPVTVTGRFGPAAEQVWVTDRADDRVWLLAPLVVDGTDAALVIVRGSAAEPGPLRPVPVGSVTVNAVLAPGEDGGAAFDPDARTLGAVRLPALVNELADDLYDGYAVSTSPSVSGGLRLVDPPESEVSWTVGLRNLAYAAQWWVFGAFAVFMWWRIGTDIVAARRARVA